MYIYITNMQYIRNYHAAYKYMMQLAHARPTIRLVNKFMVCFIVCLWVILHVPFLRIVMFMSCNWVSLSELNIDGTTGRFHICIMVRPSPVRHGWLHEVCRGSVTARESALASVTARGS